MLFDRQIYVFNDCPIYSDKFLPYVTPPGKPTESCCTIYGAEKIMRKKSHEVRNGEISIRYLKAKMTLHKDLDRYEMARLLQAQVNSNGYAGKKGWNTLPGLFENFKPYLTLA